MLWTGLRILCVVDARTRILPDNEGVMQETMLKSNSIPRTWFVVVAQAQTLLRIVQSMGKISWSSSVNFAAQLRVGTAGGKLIFAMIVTPNNKKEIILPKNRRQFLRFVPDPINVPYMSNTPMLKSSCLVVLFAEIYRVFRGLTNENFE